jgi:hypothetical protein
MRTGVVFLARGVGPCVYMTAVLGSRTVQSWEKDGRRVLGFLCELIAVFGGTCAERMSWHGEFLYSFSTSRRQLWAFGMQTR